MLILVCKAAEVDTKLAETVLILLSSAADVAAKVLLTSEILLSNVADTVANPDEVATLSPPTVILVALIVVADISTAFNTDTSIPFTENPAAETVPVTSKLPAIFASD